MLSVILSEHILVTSFASFAPMHTAATTETTSPARIRCTQFQILMLLCL